LRFVDLHSRLDAGSVALMVFSLYGFLGNVMLDYNWGTNPITNSFAIIYSSTLREVIPFPYGYYGIGAGIYFGLFLFSFSILNHGKPRRVSLLETISLASAIVVLFELGLWYFVPDFMNVWVIDAVRDTPLRYFTNVDLLALSVAVFISSQVLVHQTRGQSNRRH
jgi:hypothetical protein